MLPGTERYQERRGQDKDVEVCEGREGRKSRVSVVNEIIEELKHDERCLSKM